MPSDAQPGTWPPLWYADHAIIAGRLDSGGLKVLDSQIDSVAWRCLTDAHLVVGDLRSLDQNAVHTFVRVKGFTFCDAERGEETILYAIGLVGRLVVDGLGELLAAPDVLLAGDGREVLFFRADVDPGQLGQFAGLPSG